MNRIDFPVRISSIYFRPTLVPVDALAASVVRPSKEGEEHNVNLMAWWNARFIQVALRIARNKTISFQERLRREEKERMRAAKIPMVLFGGKPSKGA